MIIKTAGDRRRDLDELDALAKSADRKSRCRIEDEIGMVRAGLKGESESAYLIDFDFGKSDDMAVIHDLRIEVDGRVAQIDHILIHSSLACFVLETKHFRSGLKITETGEFLRWDERKKTYEGMPSPIAQNERHIAVLRDLVKEIWIPGNEHASTPTFHSFVLISPNARIDRPSGYDTANVIKADQLGEAVGRCLSPGKPGIALGKDQLAQIGKKVAGRHQPITFNYAKKFGCSEGADLPPILADDDPAPREWDIKRKRKAKSASPFARGIAAFILLAGMGGMLQNLSGQLMRGLQSANTLTRLPSPTQMSPSSRANQNTQRGMTGTKSTRPDEPVVGSRIDTGAITLFDKSGAQIGEVRGDLPKIKEEMQQPGLGIRQANPIAQTIRNDVPKKLECDPKPVMTDAEIAACRKN